MAFFSLGIGTKSNAGEDSKNNDDQATEEEVQVSQSADESKDGQDK